MDADAARADVAARGGLTWQRVEGAWGRLRAREGAWRHVRAREGAWRHVEARGGAVESLSGAWGRVRSPMAARYPRMCRSALDDLSGTFKSEIGAIFAAVMQRAVVCAV